MDSSKKNKCPACGAMLPAFSLKCPECGHVFSLESDSSREIRDEIRVLQQQLLAAKDDKDRIVIINTFSVPNTKEGLMNMLVFSANQFHSVDGIEEISISNAWLNRAKQAYTLLRMQSAGDKETLEQLRQYAYLENGKTKATQSNKTRNKKKRIRLLIVISGVVFVIYLFLLILSNLNTEQEPKNVRRAVMELIQEGRYDDARIKAAEAEYSWEEQELNELINQAQNK